MAATEPLSSQFIIKSHIFLEKEISILEAILLEHICLELREIFRIKFKQYFKLMKYSLEMENTMLDNNFLRHIIEDILLTQTYTLSGISFLYANS